VPAALQGNRTALDAMAEIPAAHDVRGYEVHARQVIEEAAKRGSAYAETLFKRSKTPRANGRRTNPPMARTQDARRMDNPAIRRQSIVRRWTAANSPRPI